ncbi:phospholipase A [Alteromonas sediminis]|uniref:phospholipase A n=1 Tax=Alteromonas sediminis TaxID=2259342 RepID=UPI001F0CC1AE|nr:phospholipase A [Alteromonas sediminis]
MKTNSCCLFFLTLLSSLSSGAFADTPIEECVLAYFYEGKATMTLKDVRDACTIEKTERQTTQSTTNSSGIISRRINSERQTQHEPFVITPHKMNYFLPAISTTEINRTVYEGVNGIADNLEDLEAKYQLSLKVPLNASSILIDGDGLYAGFTLQAWWQIYADDISKPFRETNYQPELFYFAPVGWQPFGGNTSVMVGIEHQSNGRRQALSRSWNRVYASFLYEKDNFAMALRPWVRLSEDPKTSEFDAEGDDNPDIDDFMGHYELGMVYNWNSLELSFTGRRNFSTHKGAAELGLTFPLWGKIHGYATVFTGYGESMIDYNHKQTRVGLGIALNGVL